MNFRDRVDGWKTLVIAPVHVERDGNLAQVILANHAPRGSLAPRHGREQNTGKESDNGDCQKQLEQGKSTHCLSRLSIVADNGFALLWHIATAASLANPIFGTR